MKDTRLMELTFTPTGSLELAETDSDMVLWASDDDDDFRDEFADEFLTEKDAERVVDWLLDQEIITDEEEAVLEIYAEDGEGETIDAE